MEPNALSIYRPFPWFNSCFFEHSNFHFFPFLEKNTWAVKRKVIDTDWKFESSILMEIVLRFDWLRLKTENSRTYWSALVWIYRPKELIFQTFKTICWSYFEAPLKNHFTLIAYNIFSYKSFLELQSLRLDLDEVKIFIRYILCYLNIDQMTLNSIKQHIFTPFIIFFFKAFNYDKFVGFLKFIEHFSFSSRLLSFLISLKLYLKISV